MNNYAAGGRLRGWERRQPRCFREGGGGGRGGVGREDDKGLLAVSKVTARNSDEKTGVDSGLPQDSHLPRNGLSIAEISAAFPKL